MRKYTICFSVVAHASAAIALVVIPLFAAERLPTVRDNVAWIRATIEVPPVPAAPARRQPVTPTTITPSFPVVAPDELPPLDFQTPVSVPGLSNADLVGDGPIVSGIPGGDPNVFVPPPPLVQPVVREPVRPGGAVSRPRKIVDVAPLYPALALAARKEGDVLLEAVIAEDGSVRDLRVVRSVPLLDQAAVDAVRQWRFTPTTLNGTIVPVIMTVTVSFKLR